MISTMTKGDGVNTRTAALVIIGNEILSGRTQDTNTQRIAELLTAHGVVLQEVRVIPDEESRIVDTVNEIRPHYDYVFTTGGIGPTHDDITSESMAKAFNVPLLKSEDAVAALRSHHDKDEDLTPARLKMAMVPEGASLISNPVSGAPGFVIENVYVMAGVPIIMDAMMNHILASIKTGAPILSNSVAFDLPESEIADDLAGLQERFSSVQMGSYPHYHAGMFTLSIVLRSTDPADLMAATKGFLDVLKSRGVEPSAVSLDDRLE